MPAHLNYTIPDGPQQVDLGDEPVTVGRQIGNYVTLHDDTLISRFHCVIEARKGAVAVRDLGSRNGTYVNGQKVADAAELKDGDVVRVGKTDFVLDLGLPKKRVPAKPKPPNEPAAARAAAGEAKAAHQAAGPMKPAADVRGLAQIVGELPNKSVRPGDMVLLNARGKIAMSRGEENNNAPAESVTLMRLILLVCFRTGASDIHLEPKPDGYAVRVRIDGTMIDLASLQKPIGLKLGQLVKVLSDIDISKKDAVQEGSFACRVTDRRVDYRVSFTPGLYGQKLVVRVLDSANAPQHLWDLGLPDDQFKAMDRTVRRNEGLVLVCGPTGSGKSSSLYAVLRSIDSKERNVVTIEDPVEIRLDGINQIPVNDQQGNSFAALLRSVLRQDPDVVLVGEIRDNETATTAVQASMTGHLVLSTLHSRDSVSAVFRLLDLGVEAYQAASGLQAIVSQRLVRTVCPRCRLQKTASDLDRQLTGRGDLQAVYEAKGCSKCLGTGYQGRKAIFEVLHVTEAVRDAVIGQKDPAELYNVLRATGYRRLKDAAMDLVVAGDTTLDEADRVTGN